MASTRAIERPALLRSIAVAMVLGVLGIAWGLATGSQMILLDGIYGVIGILLSWLLLRASALASEGPSRRYPFGREAFTPFVIGIQGFVLLAALLYAAVEAIYVILEGGSSVAAGWAIAYGAIATIASLAVWLWMRRVTGSSDLLAAEATAWRVGAFRGVGMVIGFAFMGLLTGSALDDAAPYVDPVMVLVTCALFVWAPVAMVRTTLRELLERVPPDEIRVPVQAAIDAIGAALRARSAGRAHRQARSQALRRDRRSGEPDRDRRAGVRVPGGPPTPARCPALRRVAQRRVQPSGPRLVGWTGQLIGDESGGTWTRRLGTP